MKRNAFQIAVRLPFWVVAGFLSLLSVLVPAVAGAADNPGEVKKKVLELTGGRHTRIAWNQNDKIRVFDTKEGVIRDTTLPGSQPLFTADGRKVLASGGKAGERFLAMYDFDTKRVSKVVTAAESNLLTVWRDVKARRDWVYVNDCGSKEQAWDAPCGSVFRFPLDKSAAREMCWDRTSSHFYLMFSEDGTRACFEPNWSNIGQLTVVYDAKGGIDQDKCQFKPLGGGCFPGMAPDNSYRVFRLDGDHKAITMCDADGANPRQVKVAEMPGVGDKGRNVWLTRWSTDPRFLTLMAPDGDDAKVWIGRFDSEFTKIEGWVQVTNDGPKCWQSHAWIAPKP
jgi:hypothetical protein